MTEAAATHSAQEDPFLTPREVRAMLRIGVTKYHELLNSGELESDSSLPTPTGSHRRRLFRQSTIDAFLTRNAAATTP